MRITKTMIISSITVFMLLFSTSAASAAVMWGKTELKQGQLGKVTIVSDVNASKIVNNTIQPDKAVKKGEEYRVYSHRKIGDKEFYGVGGGLFIEKTSKIKYETPSKSKLAQLKAEAAKQPSVQEIHSLLKGWNLSAVSLFNGKNHIAFEKFEPIGKKWAVNRLTISKWDETGASFENDVREYIQNESKSDSVQFNIKKNTSSLFESTAFNGIEYVYDYIVKTNTGYTVYEINLEKVNEGWRHGVADAEVPTQATMKQIEGLAPQQKKKMKKFVFVDTQKSEPIMKTMSSKKEWKVNVTTITGNALTQFVPNGWTRSFEKKTAQGNYGLEINKMTISKQKHAELLKKFKSISTLTNSTSNVKAYRTTDPISVVDDFPGGRSGDNRIVFVEKKGSANVDYYKIYFDTPEYYPVEQWNATDKSEANKAFTIVIDSIIDANSK